LRGRKLTPQQVGNSAIEVAKPAVDRELDAALRLRRLSRRHAVGAGDDHEVLVTEVVGGGPHHAQLAHELVGGDQGLARNVAASLGHYLVFDVRGGDAGVDVQIGRALDVEEVAVAGVHVDHNRGEL